MLRRELRIRLMKKEILLSSICSLMKLRATVFMTLTQANSSRRNCSREETQSNTWGIQHKYLDKRKESCIILGKMTHKESTGVISMLILPMTFSLPQRCRAKDLHSLILQLNRALWRVIFALNDHRSNLRHCLRLLTSTRLPSII